MSDIIMTVQEIIDSTFGDPDYNSVNFRLLRTVLLVLSNHLRLLNRHVQVNMNSRLPCAESKSNTSVTQVQIYTNEKKKKKKVLSDALKPSKGNPAAQKSDGKTASFSTNLDAVERRERELRIINQRSDSHEEPAQTPTPMASAPSLTKENLIIVGQRDRPPRLSVVTQEQFIELVSAVRELQHRFGAAGSSEFPENAEFLKALRKGASLTDAMAAFQLSARLTASEKAFIKMASLVTELARNTPGVDVRQFESLEKGFIVQGKEGKDKQDESRNSQEPSLATHTQKEIQITDKKLVYMTEEEMPKDCVTHPELAEALEEVSKEILVDIKKAHLRTKADNIKTEKILSTIKQKVLTSLELGDRLNRLEAVVEDYVNRIVAIDTGLSAQVTSYQDQLQQMQYELESALHTLEEELANLGTDPEVIADLGTKFTTLQHDVEKSIITQQHLKIFQSSMAEDLASLWQQIELIRDAKADREEVTDALRDKIGLEDLNGMIYLDHFNAVRGDLENKIRAAYDKFNSQELVWQKVIDDIMRAINEKSNWVQFHALRDDMNQHLNVLREKVKELLEIVGEPRAFAVSKSLFRDTKCISCRTAAHMDMKVPAPWPKLPAFGKPDGSKIHQPEEHGDHQICFEGQPVSHPIDPRAHVCRRYCGGSHTTVSALPRLAHGMVITRLKVPDTAEADDGGIYKTEEPILKKPCVPCNAPPEGAPQEINKKTNNALNAPAPVDLVSSTLSTELLMRMSMGRQDVYDNGSLAPPHLLENDD